MPLRTGFAVSVTWPERNADPTAAPDWLDKRAQLLPVSTHTNFPIDEIPRGAP